MEELGKARISSKKTKTGLEELCASQHHNLTIRVVLFPDEYGSRELHDT